MKKAFAVAIDGPAGAGKSNASRGIAHELDAGYLDTGAMYRAVGLYMLKNGIDPADTAAVALRCGDADIVLEYEKGNQRTFLCGEDVSERIREEDCSAASSLVSKVPAVREKLVKLQRQLAANSRIVVDGRDIGTQVLPNAELKIYLTATAEVRAQRRYDEIIKNGGSTDFKTVLEDIIARDYQDTHREISPLRKAEDAIEVDTSDMTLEQVVAHIVKLAEERL